MARMASALAALVFAAAVSGAAGQLTCASVTCPFGFTCIAPDAMTNATCLPINPCEFADCGSDSFCDILFSPEQCNPLDTQGDFICAPTAVCKPNSEDQFSLCGTSNPCQGSFQLGFFQLCVEQLEDPEACFAGAYGSYDQCDTFEDCLNPPTPPSFCSSVTCPEGLVCAESLVDPQGCAQSPIYEGIEECNRKAECVLLDPCSVVTCPTNSECVVAFDPNEECLSNNINECPSVGQCIPLPDPCDSITCPFGFTCIAPDAFSEAVCLPLNPCTLTDCGDDFFCEVVFTPDQCNPLPSSDSFPCAPVAVCNPNSQTPNSICVNDVCQGSFQLCVEQLEDPEACFDGEYGSFEFCDTFEQCLNPPTPAPSCSSVTCEGGLVCALSLADPQGCQQSQVYEGIEECNKKAECVFTNPCDLVTCPSGAECVEIFDPSEECLSNDLNECPSIAQCVPFVDPCDELLCPFGFTCIATNSSDTAQCLPINPCLTTQCPDGFFCDLIFSLDQCRPLDSGGSFTCAPSAVCRADSLTPVSDCGPSNPCQGSFQLCAEELDDPEACFTGVYETPEDCGTSSECLNPLTPAASCDDVTCTGGLICVEALFDPQGCAQSPIYEGTDECKKKAECVVSDPCDVTICPLGFVCSKIFDPEEECLSNSIDECATVATCEEDCPVSVVGDVDGDDLVTVSDVVIVVGFILGTGTLEECVQANVDLNSSGTVDVPDVVLLTSLIVGSSPN